MKNKDKEAAPVVGRSSSTRSVSEEAKLAGYAAARLGVDSVFTRRRSYHPAGGRFRKFWFDRIRALDTEGGIFVCKHGISRRVALWCPPYDRPAKPDRRPVEVCNQWYCPFCRGRQLRKDAEVFWATAKADPTLMIARQLRQTPFREGYNATFDLPVLSVAEILGGKAGIVAGVAYRRPLCRIRPDGQLEWAVQDTAVALVRPEPVRTKKTPGRPRQIVPPHLLREAARAVVVSEIAYAGKYPAWMFFLSAEKAATAVLGWYRVQTYVRVGAARAKSRSSSPADD